MQSYHVNHEGGQDPKASVKVQWDLVHAAWWAGESVLRKSVEQEDVSPSGPSDPLHGSSKRLQEAEQASRIVSLGSWVPVVVLLSLAVRLQTSGRPLRASGSLFMEWA